MKKSDSIVELAKALIVFHSKVGKISKNSFNKFFKNNYADLADILSAISVPLNESGLAIISSPEDKGTLTTLLIHGESGQYFESSFDMMAAKNDPQGLAAAVTYARRVSIGSMLNLNIDEDDDGNKAAADKKNEDDKAKENPFVKSYKKSTQVSELVAKATNEGDLYALHGANKELIVANPGLTEEFKKRKEWLQNEGR